MADEIEREEVAEGEQAEEKLFTQAELDAVVSKRVNAVKRGMPSAEELTEFRTWKQTHTDTDTQLQTVTGERDTAQSELEMAKRENLLLRHGIPADDVDYYVYKISKSMEDDQTFEEAAKKFLKENKRQTVRMDTGARFNGSRTQTANDEMNQLLRGALK